MDKSLLRKQIKNTICGIDYTIPEIVSHFDPKLKKVVREEILDMLGSGELIMDDDWKVIWP